MLQFAIIGVWIFSIIIINDFSYKEQVLCLVMLNKIECNMTFIFTDLVKFRARLNSVQLLALDKNILMININTSNLELSYVDHKIFYTKNI